MLQLSDSVKKWFVEELGVEEERIDGCYQWYVEYTEDDYNRIYFSKTDITGQVIVVIDSYESSGFFMSLFCGVVHAGFLKTNLKHTQLTTGMIDIHPVTSMFVYQRSKAKSARK